MSTEMNPGGAMVAEIDKEVAKFREIQAQLQQVRSDLQLVLGQQTENEMVFQELELMEASGKVYKMVGPVLIPNSLDDAKETVQKRMEFIGTERKRLEQKSQDLEKQGTEISLKVQQMQTNLQKATHAAVEQIKAAAATEQT